MSADEMGVVGGRWLVGHSGMGRLGRDGGRLWNRSGTGRLREWCIGSGLRNGTSAGKFEEEFGFKTNSAF